MRKLFAVLPSLFLLTGCPSFTTQGTARVIPKGDTQFQVGVGGQQLREWSLDETGVAESLTFPGFELGVSHAVSDSAEVGGKIWFIGAELNAKFQLHRSESPESGIDVALAPAVSYFPFSSENSAGETVTVSFAFVHLPLLVGVNLPGGSQIVLGPRISDTIVMASGGGTSESANVFWLGGSLGIAIKAGDKFRIMPQVSAMYPAAASHGLETTTDLAFKGVIVQGQLALVFGG
jgi:hypothetical protein